MGSGGLISLSSETENLKHLDTLAHSDIIFTMSDEILAKVNYQRMVLGKKINEDLSVISTSDGSFLYLIFPKITFIKDSGRRMGKCASELIISLIASGDNAKRFI